METQTLTINNFTGTLTRYKTGNINSGLANYNTTWGSNSFTNPPALMFNQTPISIGGSVVTDLIVAGKARVENGVTYMYVIGHLGRLYKIQVNDPVTYNPDYDNPVLLATLSNSQHFEYGGSLDFYGSTEKIFIGHDEGMTKINFDGTGETVIGITDATHWIDNSPRLQHQFAGKIYITNGANIAEIDSTELVTTYTKLNPGFPANSQARDIDTTPDGRYVVVTVTRAALGNILSTAPDLSSIASESLLVYWNGVDTGATSFTSTPNFAQSGYYSFGPNSYIFGYDIAGSVLQVPDYKVWDLIWAQSPYPNAVGSSGDFVGWVSTEAPSAQNQETYSTGNFMLYGRLSQNEPVGLFRQMRLDSSLTNGDIIRMPFLCAIGNQQFAGPTSGYALGAIGDYLTNSGKTYFSTLEYDGATTAYKLYSFKNSFDATSGACLGNYDTQVQLFSKKKKVTEYRIYTEPCVGIEAFTIGILNPVGTVISGTYKTFVASPGQDLFQFNPQHAPSFGLGLRVTNASPGFVIIHKVEIDYTDYGK